MFLINNYKDYFLELLMSIKFSSLVSIPFAKATKLVGLYKDDTGNVANCTVDPTSVITTEDLQTNLQKYVTLNTSQTIDSTKTFTQPITIQFSTDMNSNTFKDYIFLKDTSLDYTVTSQFNKTYYTNSLRDKNGKYIGYTEIKYHANGSSSHSMCARTRRDNGIEISESISVTVNKDGTVKTKSPTPPINDNSTQIATTNWVKNILNAIYPVGSIYLTVNNTNPLQSIGIGTWSLVSQDRVVQGYGKKGAAGTILEAGLPNITGTIKPIGGHHTQGSGTGAFVDNGGDKIWCSADKDKSQCREMKFDASKSSNIYGKSDTVQPPAYIVYVWKRTS
jgi:hypothetical protein